MVFLDFSKKIRELTEENNKEKARNFELEENYVEKIEKLERKLAETKEIQVKIRFLEKENKNFLEKIEELFEEKGSLENKYQNYTKEIEKVLFLLIFFL